MKTLVLPDSLEGMPELDKVTEDHRKSVTVRWLLMFELAYPEPSV